MHSRRDTQCRKVKTMAWSDTGRKEPLMNQDRKNQFNRMKSYKEYISVMKKQKAQGSDKKAAPSEGRQTHVSGNQ